MLAAFVFLQEEAGRNLLGEPGGIVEGTIINLVQWLRLAIETTSAIIICIGILVAIYGLIRILIPPHLKGYNQVRLTLARYLALALEFQLGADILSTAVAPTWDQIGKLGAIAVIRTALNYFLTREMREEREVTKGEEGLERND